MRKEKAITLISLVITIIVLIILASVTVYLNLENNGIFNKAKQARQQYEVAANEEKKLLANASDEIDNYINNNREIRNEMKIDKLIVRGTGNGTIKQGQVVLTLNVKNYNKLIFDTLNMASTSYNRLYVWDANDAEQMNPEYILVLMSERDGESGIFKNKELDVSQYNYINIRLESGRGDTVYIENMILK